MKIIALFVFALSVLISLKASASVMLIPREIKRIEDKAFANDSSLSTLILPEGLLSIGEKAFADSGVKTVHFPKSISEIADNAFDGCEFEAVAKTGTYAYEYCKTRGIKVHKTAEEYEGTLTIYTPLADEIIDTALLEFEALYTNVQFDILCMSDEYCLKRMASENAHGSDLIWGIGAQYINEYRQYLLPYIPKNISNIDLCFRDQDCYWTSMAARLPVFLVNTDKVGKKDIPRTWKDLANSKWKGKIVIANPTSTSDAFLVLCNILMAFGTAVDDYDSGWRFLSSLKDNLVIQSRALYAHQKVDKGEYPIAIVMEETASQYQHDIKGAHLSVVYPEDGIIVVPEIVAIEKGCSDSELAKLFVDFISGNDWQTTQETSCNQRPIINNATMLLKPSLDELNIIPFDYSYVDNNRTIIIERWKQLFIK